MAQALDTAKEREEISRQAIETEEGDVPSPKTTRIGVEDVRTKKIPLVADDLTITAVIGVDLYCK